MNDPMPAIRSILGMPPETDPTEDLLTKALHAHLPEDALAAAQIATARAIREQTKELHTANLIAYLALGLSDRSDITDKGGLQQVADDIVQGLGSDRWIGRYRP